MELFLVSLLFNKKVLFQLKNMCSIKKNISNQIKKTFKLTNIVETQKHAFDLKGRVGFFFYYLNQRF